MKFRDDIQKAMNKSEVTLAVLVDYSKAFNTVYHETLLQILHEMNFTKECLMIIQDYLCDRKQFVQVDRRQQIKHITCSLWSTARKHSRSSSI